MKRFFCLIVAVILMISAIPALAYEELAKGSKGEEVKKLQERLIELGYLTGTADGIYGGQTKAAVEWFQAVNEVHYIVDGIADEYTQEELFSTMAKKPDQKVYNEINYEGMMRNPDEYYDSSLYSYTHYKFTGKVIQIVSEDAGTGRIPMTLARVATRGNSKDVVCVKFYQRGNTRILEGDNLTLYCRFSGLENYKTVLGANSTYPLFHADAVAFN